jgi:hypothetical protein
MMRRLILAMILTGVLSESAVDASEPSFPGAPPAPAEESAHLSALLRGLLLQHLPSPLVESHRHWGQQSEALVGLKWRQTGPLRLTPEPQKAWKNDGHWQRLRVEAINPAHTLTLALGPMISPAPGRVHFDAYLGLDVKLIYEQQLWKKGARLYGGETRAKCRAALLMRCEVNNRFEPRPGAILPDAVFRVHVNQAQLFYTGLVCEHTLGVGGDAAKALGEAIHRFISEVRPTLERDLLAKANAAIVKAADSREVRIELDALLNGKTLKIQRSAQ